jgi:hypothetical protein
MTEPRLATPRDLWHAVDSLVNPTRVRLPRDPDEWVTLPSLWDQLAEAVDSLTGRATTGAQQSRPPCNTEALSLLLEIAGKVRDGCYRAGLKRTRDVPRDLRQTVSNAIRTNNPDIIDAAHTQIRHWIALIKLTISNDPDRTWPLHGAACRICGSVTIPAWNEDGQEVRQDAIRAYSKEGTIDHLKCGFCGATLTGDDLTQILRDTPKRPVQLPIAPEALL